MSEQVCANMSLYKRGRLQQGYSLLCDMVIIKLKAHGFSITVEMKEGVNESRPQAVIKVCGHAIFNTEGDAVADVGL